MQMDIASLFVGVDLTSSSVGADTLQFYAFSADKSAGNGKGDVVSDKSVYNNLNQIKNWRRMFSSLWAEDPFVFEGRTYLSFEHAYQSSKYRINGYDEMADKFTLESDDDISRKIGKEVQKAGRLVKLTKAELEKWEEVTRDVKQDIYRAKFTMNSNPGKALLATENAMLVNAGPRIKTIRCTRMEALREELREASCI